jgi:hypothetical protein
VVGVRFAFAAPIGPHQLCWVPVLLTRDRAQVVPRPRPQWIGELVIEILGAYACFGGSLIFLGSLFPVSLSSITSPSAETDLPWKEGEEQLAIIAANDSAERVQNPRATVRKCVDFFAFTRSTATLLRLACIMLRKGLRT